MKRLVGEHEVQLKGAEMLQALINSDAQVRCNEEAVYVSLREPFTSWTVQYPE